MKKKIIVLFLIVLIFAFFASSTLINAASNECVFYDDFENGAIFWDYGDHQSMRISDGKMITDVKNSLAGVSLRGNKVWNNFMMDTVFETDCNETGWFGIHVGYGTPSEIHFVVHDDGFYTVQTPVSESGEKAFELENNKQYLLRITAQTNEVTVQIKGISENDFSVEWKGIYESPVSGGIRLASYDQIARIDSVKITQAVDDMIFFKDSMVAVQQGESKAILPETLKEFDSIRYTCSGDSFTVSEDGTVTANSNGNGYGIVTATATSGDETYTASYDVVRTIPVESLGNGGYFTMNTGDTRNLNVNISPSNATDTEVLWTVDNEEALELVGDKTGETIGVRALSPAKNVRVSARLKDDTSIIYSAYITVEGQPTNIKAQKFTFNGKKREIPYGMLGVSMDAAIDSADTIDAVNEYEAAHLPLLNEMKIQQLRLTVKNYDAETDTFSGKDFTYKISDYFKIANALDIPVNVSLTEYFDSADKIIAFAKAVRAVTDKEICLDIWGECYDGRMKDYSGWKVACAADYTDFLKEIYPKVKAAFPDGSVKIGATASDEDSYNFFGGGTGNAQTDLLSAWNHELSEARDYFDAVTIHHYSNTVSDMSTQGVLDGLSVAAESLTSGIDKQAEDFFAGKEFWMNEWGDLPKYLTTAMLDSTKARQQYMKSLGSAMGYLHRQLEMTVNENVTMSAYYSYDNAMGFGVVDTVDGVVHKMPSYYMFSMIGDVFAKNEYIYDMTDSADSDLSYFADTKYYGNNKVTRVNAWAFGDGTQMNEAIFENASEYYVKAYIPGYKLQKQMLYGNGENPLPDLAVNNNSNLYDLPTNIPLPDYFENEEYVSYIVLPPYSILRANLKEDMEWETVFEDDFSTEDLSKWTATEDFTYDIENGGMKIPHWINNGVYPDGVNASKNIAIEFDYTEVEDGTELLVWFTSSDDSFFRVRLKDGMIEIENDSTYEVICKTWPNMTDLASAKVELTNGMLKVYSKVKGAESFVCQVSTEHSLIDLGKEYLPGFWALTGNEKIVDNIVIKSDREYFGTEKIKPIYDTIFEDDFSDSTLSKWEKPAWWPFVSIGASVTGDKTLKLESNNKYLTPITEFESDTIEVQFDFFGEGRGLFIEFYEINNEENRFRVRVPDNEWGTLSEVCNLDGTAYHYFGGTIEKNKWQTVKLVLNDGFLNLYVKDAEQTEFDEKEHSKGRPYSYIWYDEQGNNVSLLKKDTKYGVRMYMWNCDVVEVQVDNFKINSVKTAVSETASNGDNISFEVKELQIEVKTDDGWEATSKPVSGAINRFTIESEAAQSGTIGGKMITAVYDENEELLIDVAISGLSETTSTEVMIPYEFKKAETKIMLWENFENLKPLLKAFEY